jgi:hypothetical protein
MARYCAINRPPMGAARSEPDPPLSMRTATAMTGCSPSCAGAKPMNHECGACSPPSCAVPVLPAERASMTPYRVTSACPAYARPSSPFTASTMAARVCRAASVLSTRVPPREVNRSSTSSDGVPSSLWLRTSRTTYGCGITPSPAIAAATSAIWTGVATDWPCPKAALANSASPENGPQSPSIAPVR